MSSSERYIRQVSPDELGGKYGEVLAHDLALQRFNAWNAASLDRTPEELQVKFPVSGEQNLRMVREGYRETAEGGGLFVAEIADEVVGQISVKRDASSRHSGLRGRVEIASKFAETALFPGQPGRVYLAIGSIAVAHQHRGQGMAHDLLEAAIAGRRPAERTTAYIYEESQASHTFFTGVDFNRHPADQTPQELYVFGEHADPARQYRYLGPSVHDLQGILNERKFDQGYM